MANVTVRKVETEKPALAPVLDELRHTFEEVRKKAFELFERRGCAPGGDFDDWVKAERELFFVPPAELAQTGNEFKIQMSAPGFEAKDLQVMAQEGEILVRGDPKKRTEKREPGVYYSEFGEKTLFRRFEIPVPFDMEHVIANLDNGMLTVRVPKKAADVSATANVAEPSRRESRTAEAAKTEVKVKVGAAA